MVRKMHLSQTNNRIVQLDNKGWFFVVSEGNIGPFASVDEAEKALEGLIKVAQNKNYSQQLQYLSQFSRPSRKRASSSYENIKPSYTQSRNTGREISPKELQISREGEMSNPPSRTERFFQMEGEWYFNKRGGDVAGPYRCLSDAEQEVTQITGGMIGDPWKSYDCDG